MPESHFENKQEALVARSRADQGDHHNTLMIRRDAKIAFLLFTEAGISVHKNREFTLIGDTLQLSGQTDEEGKFELVGIPYGLYELFVGDARFVIPAVHPVEEHHPVHIPYQYLPDHRDAWVTPEPEELEGDIQDA